MATETEVEETRFTVDSFVERDAAVLPAFTADGESVVFLSTLSGHNQAYKVGASGGSERPSRLVETEGLVYGVYPRPGHAEALFVVDDGGDEQYQLHLVDLATGAERVVAGAPKVIYNFASWSADGRLLAFSSNKRDVQYFDLYVLDLETGVEKVAWQADGMQRAGRFSPSGRLLLAERPNLDLPGDNDLFVIDVTAPGSAKEITSHDGAAEWRSPSAPSLLDATFQSETIVMALSDEGREFMGLQRIDIESGTREFLLAPDWDIEAFAIAKDGRRLAAVTNVDGYSHLSVYELSADGRLGAEIATPHLPRGIIASPSFRGDGKALVFSFEGPRDVSDIWLLDLEARSLQRLTESDSHGLTAADLPEPELVHYRSFDGREIPAFFYRQAGLPATGALPCVVLVHGGPESQSRPALAPSYAGAAYLLARGELCLLVPNVRGSTGYGKEYSHADDVEKRMDSVKDLIAARDWLATTGTVDPERIGVMGSSYGGFMTLAAITEAPEGWAAAVDGFGIANWETFMQFTGPWRRAHRAREYGSDPEFLRTISPIHKASQITAPLMIIQGDHDVRVPPVESEQIAEAVRRNEGIVEYALFEREGHGIRRLANRLRMNRMIVDFLREHLVRKG